ncbi:uncharacterized protein LOC107676645 [Sinocyclocheilus anshuiensis]|uniref:uncharacterized protein LOC107676645 n=1 Tax=Sinocyclocheilus anshuiensis TaxID=1608454 RepID=UPI0007B9E3FD|nr:PREDICTED: uncharacterized protein LOC107676645 [Sinocyclocheilus anshuiensis]
MKLFGLYFSAVWMLCCCCCLVYGRGHGLCIKEKLITKIYITTELQSKVLLPCLFEPALFGSDLTMNSSAVWTQINKTVDYILEIIVNGQISVWNNRHNRINGFRDAAASENFSILIRDVRLSDLGLYRCQLYRDFNCSLGYKEIEISLAAVEFSLLSNWQLIAAGGGGFLLPCLISVCVYYTWTKRQTVNESVNHRSHYCHDVDGETNADITYASVVFKSHNCHDNEVLLNNDAVNVSASELVSSEKVLYATVKQRDRR